MRAPAIASVVAIAVLAACRALGAATPHPRAAVTAPRAAAPDTAWQPATAAYAFRFPRDHASHPAYRTEWWYYTGQLAATNGRAFGFELTFFRIGISRARVSSRSAWAPHTIFVAHAALTDETRGRFAYADVADRPVLGMAGVDTSQYRVWVGDWSAGLAADGRTHALAARAPAFALRLELEARMPPAVHGHDGRSEKGADPAEASHYYSIPRLAARGTVVDGRDTLAVTGEAWMDHEFGSGALGPEQRGWDWFALRLADGRALMLYRMRLASGATDPASSGSLIAADGAVRHLARSEFTIAETGTWTSPHSHARYPMGWRVRVPDAGIDLVVAPAVRDQELTSRAMGGVTYWEGSVRVRAASGAEAGRGYVELTGYAGPPPGR
jgi:predicted secreted hydrolase